MEIELYINNIKLLIQQMDSAPLELKLQIFATCSILLQRIQDIQSENSYIGEKIVQILDHLERECGLASEGRFVLNNTSAALNKLEDINESFNNYSLI